MSADNILQVKERVATALGEVAVEITLPRPEPTPLPTLTWRVRCWCPGKGEDLALTSPGLAVAVARAAGPIGYTGSPQPLPVDVGVMGDSGGSMERGVASWSATTVLTEQQIRALDALRDAELGLHTEITFAALLVPLAPRVELHRQGNVAVHFRVEPLRWTWRERLPNDHWRRLLSGLGWPRKRIFELADEAFDGVKDFPGADKAFRAAQDALLRGKRGDAIAKCRLIIEQVLRENGHRVERGRMLWEEAEAAGLPKEVIGLIKAFKDVASIEHHAPHDDWCQADAQFMLMLALALAEYAGTLQKRSGEP